MSGPGGNNSANRGDVATLPASGLLAFIDRAARDPDFDIAKFGALLDRHEAMVERQKRDAFNQAMAEVQADIGAIAKSGKNPSFQNPYAKMEDLDREARPVYSRHGFSVRYGSAEAPREGWLRVTLTIAHRDGYSEQHYLDGPIDSAPSERVRRTGIQSVGSTVTYLRRYLLQMVLNLVPANDPADDDGEAPRQRPPPPRPAGPPRQTISSWLDDLETQLAGVDSVAAMDAIVQTADVQKASKLLRGEALQRFNAIVAAAIDRLGDGWPGTEEPGSNEIRPEDRLEG